MTLQRLPTMVHDISQFRRRAFESTLILNECVFSTCKIGTCVEGVEPFIKKKNYVTCCLLTTNHASFKVMNAADSTPLMDKTDQTCMIYNNQ